MNSDFGVGWASIWSRGCFWFRLWGGLQTWHFVPAVGWASIIVGVGFVSGLLGVGWGVKSGQSSFEAAPPPQGGCAAYYVCVLISGGCAAYYFLQADFCIYLFLLFLLSCVLIDTVCTILRVPDRR